MKNRDKLNFDFDFLKTGSDNNENLSETSIDKDKQNNVDVEEDKELSFTKIKYNNKTKLNWKPIVIVLIIIFISFFIISGFYNGHKRDLEITQIKESAYSYLLEHNKDGFNEEVAKLKQYGIDEKQIKIDLQNKYNTEKQRIISDIAYNYENNRQQFNALKSKYLPVYFNNNEQEFNKIIEQKLGYKELSLKPVQLPKSGIIHNYTGQKAIAPFEIRTQNDGEYYYIKLVNPVSNKTCVSIFMRGGETKNLEVPLGTYKIKRASGTTWYGEQYLFGHNTTYMTSDELLTFKISNNYVEGHTLTLYKVANGNFYTKAISAEDF